MKREASWKINLSILWNGSALRYKESCFYGLFITSGKLSLDEINQKTKTK